MEASKFQQLKDELFVYISNVNYENELTEEFRQKFYRLIELCTFSMMSSGDNFFAQFLIQLKREMKLDLPSALGTRMTKEGFVMYFNPAVFLSCSLLEMQALIKHEIYHIMSGHYIRQRALRHKYSSLAVSLAMDIAINQYIVNLPLWMDNIDSVRNSYNVDLKDELTMEQYADKIQEAIDKLKKETNKNDESDKLDFEKGYIKREHDEETVHDIWNINDDFDEQAIKETVKKLAENASKGKLPDSIEQLYRELNRKSEVTWKDYLKRLLGTLPAGYKKTITRRDRRQPERLDLRGKLSRHIAEIAVAIDISGSVTDKEIEEIMSEVFSIVRNYPSDITIIECDSDIRRVYKASNIKQIKKKVNTRGNTKFTPVFEYLAKNRLRNHVLIYFTDGLGEEELGITPVHKNTIWVLTGKGEELSLKKSYGVIKRLSNVKVKEKEYEYAPNAIKEYRMLEWSSF